MGDFLKAQVNTNSYSELLTA
jgi:hypothetical protein